MAVSLRQAMDWALIELGQSESPRIDAEYLLLHVVQCARSRLLSYPEQELSDGQWQQYQSLVARRAAGEPVAYLTGIQGFWTLDLMVTQDVLIPRPDTELLVEQVLQLADNAAALTIADLGTGSGAIALAIASERPAWRVIASDASAAALAVARNNASRLSITNIEFYLGDWCQALPESVQLDMLVSNPPYIEENDPHLQQGDLRFEPLSALTAADNGLQDIAILARQASARLKPGARLLLEHGYNQGAAVRALLEEAGFAEVLTCRDIGGQERMTQGLRVSP